MKLKSYYIKKRDLCETIFHHIVRGIVIKDEQLLIANFKENHSFLPGGHRLPNVNKDR